MRDPLLQRSKDAPPQRRSVDDGTEIAQRPFDRRDRDPSTSGHVVGWHLVGAIQGQLGRVKVSAATEEALDVRHIRRIIEDSVDPCAAAPGRCPAHRPGSGECVLFDPGRGTVQHVHAARPRVPLPRRCSPTDLSVGETEPECILSADHAVLSGGEQSEALIGRGGGHRTSRCHRSRDVSGDVGPLRRWTGTDRFGRFVSIVGRPSVGRRGQVSCVARERSARPRWLMACFSSADISAKVRPSPSSGTKTGS